MHGPLVMIAGAGQYPVRLAQILAGHGERPFIAALEGAADPALSAMLMCGATVSASSAAC